MWEIAHAYFVMPRWYSHSGMNSATNIGRCVARWRNTLRPLVVQSNGQSLTTVKLKTAKENKMDY